MSQPLSKNALEQLFLNARSHHAWKNQDVSEETLHQIYDLAKWGPTAANSNPGRLVFVKSAAAKEKLLPALMGGNVDQIKAAPVTAIVAYDLEFYDHLAKLFPHADAKSWYVGNPALIESTGFRNSSLQGAYLLLAARSLGLDVCPMSGFDNAKVDELFFQGTKWKSNFIFTLGYGDEQKLHPRAARLEFAEAAKIV